MFKGAVKRTGNRTGTASKKNNTPISPLLNKPPEDDLFELFVAGMNAKAADLDLELNTETGKGQFMTTDHGVRINDDQNSP